jgi:DNA-binding beta-propeller fold protein YncE
MPASDVLGQTVSQADLTPVFTTNSYNNITPTNQSGMSSPRAVATDTVHHRLFVADPGNNRVLVYTLSATNAIIHYTADYVLGQPDFITGASATTQSGMQYPVGLAYDGATNRLFVADYYNDRVLVFTGSTISNGMPAAAVLGQPDFTTTDSATTQAGMNYPYGLAYDSTSSRLFVADQNNNRVLVFTGSTISNGMKAAKVLGQQDFTTGASATTQSGLSALYGLAYDSTHDRLFVGDVGNNRVLVFTGSTISNGMKAAKVLGQPNFTTNAAATTQSGLISPYGLAYDVTNSRLFVADSGNSRVLVFTGSTISNGMPAAAVLGQPNFTTNAAATTQSGLISPYGLAYDGATNRLFVADSGNNRLLQFNATTLTNHMPASDVLGQTVSQTDLTPVFTTSFANNVSPNQSGMGYPTAVATDTVHHRLFVADNYNNRVLVYTLSATNAIIHYNADYVLGQPDFTSNAYATTQSGMHYPYGLAYDSTSSRLFVADQNNNRVLVFTGSTISNGMDAAAVLGQPDFTTNAAATTQSSMHYPYGLAYDSTSSRLFVADQNNNRVLVFTGSTISNGMDAAAVLGQPDFTRHAAATTQSGMHYPYDLAYDVTNSRLFVADSGNSRVLVFTGSTISNGMDAAAVLGQPDFTTHASATTQSGMNYPYGLAYDGATNRLFVSDYDNSRVLVFTGSTISNGMDAAAVLGQPDFTTNAAATTQSGMYYPYGLAYDGATNRLFVADNSNNRVLLYDLRPATTTTLTSSLNPSTSGDAITLTATVSPGTATGSITFKDGTTEIGTITLSHGTAVLVTSSLTTDSHVLTAVYGTGSNSLGSTSDVLTQTVTAPPAPPTSSASSSAPAAPSGGGGGGSRRAAAPLLVSPTVTSSASSSSSTVHPAATSSVAARRAARLARLAQTASSSLSSSSIRFTTVTVYLRASSTTKSRVLSVLKPNTPVTLLQVLKDWAKVRTKDSKIGYVLRRYLRK